jgi:hypothetical protein
MATVSQLIVGEVVALHASTRRGIFLGRRAHPRYPYLQAVTWLMDNGEWFIDALDAQQDVGEVVDHCPLDVLLARLARATSIGAQTE